MNIVTPDTPLDAVCEMVNTDGYVLMHDAIDPALLARLQNAYERELESWPCAPDEQNITIPRLIERQSIFADLMVHAPTFRVARAIIGADIDLAHAGVLYHKPPHTAAHIGWHNDFQKMPNLPYPRQVFWIRCVFFIGDVTEDCGPFTLIPGTHLADGPCPSEQYNRDGQPLDVPGQIRIAAPAGSCLINNTEIWHTNTPNRSDQARRLIMLPYKHAWLKPMLDGHDPSPDFVAVQTDPLRRQLCGGVNWDSRAKDFPAYENCTEAMTA